MNFTHFNWVPFIVLGLTYWKSWVHWGFPWRLLTLFKPPLGHKTAKQTALTLRIGFMYIACRFVCTCCSKTHIMWSIWTNTTTQMGQKFKTPKSSKQKLCLYTSFVYSSVLCVTLINTNSSTPHYVSTQQPKWVKWATVINSTTFCMERSLLQSLPQLLLPSQAV